MSNETDAPARRPLLRDALVNVPPPELKAAIARATQPDVQAPKAVRNALLALRKQHDPRPSLARPQYRSTLPYLAGALSDECLSRVIDVLGEHSDDPTRAQLLEALDTVRADHADPVVAVMLAGVAEDDLPSSGLCLDILSIDQRYGLAQATPPAGPGSDQAPGDEP